MMLKRVFKTLTASTLAIAATITITTPTNSFAEYGKDTTNAKKFDEVNRKIYEAFLSPKSAASIKAKLIPDRTSAIESDISAELSALGYIVKEISKSYDTDPEFSDKLFMTFKVDSMGDIDIGNLIEANMQIINKLSLYKKHNIVLGIYPA